MKYLYLFLIIFICQCGNNIPFQEDQYMTRPLGISVTPVSGRKFQLNYFVSNQETSFIGYNVYISRSTIAEGETRLNSTLPVLILDGNAPTFKHSISEFNTTVAVSKTISVFNDAVTSFEDGTTYYFRITAYSRNGFESRPSNEVFDVARN